jgi:hypothetical protein
LQGCKKQLKAIESNCLDTRTIFKRTHVYSCICIFAYNYECGLYVGGRKSEFIFIKPFMRIEIEVIKELKNQNNLLINVILLLECFSIHKNIWKDELFQELYN